MISDLPVVISVTSGVVLSIVAVFFSMKIIKIAIVISGNNSILEGTGSKAHSSKTLPYKACVWFCVCVEGSREDIKTSHTVCGI